MVGNRVYSVLGYDPVSQTVQLRNPHGSNPQYDVTVDNLDGTTSTIQTTRGADGNFSLSLSQFCSFFVAVAYQE
jgi:hypothetical protein